MLVLTRTGMKLENSFEVPALPEQAWDLLADVPRVIPCMPGAELTEVTRPLSARYGARSSGSSKGGDRETHCVNG
jgi:hypothetical protein